ncbi:DNA methyltransferase [Streptomyces sp. C11-1]|uniref:Methyltransferase n=1 Tax=Streptomyces durocortorensis TaxID=2811104 RepID=A0ABY9W4F3_9ACTN|nr:DNA methyltransferase [Streptomyces durocortorensis]WNF31040.1 DNA methyltransferase [Streptomyces durocortorensis]
MTEPTEAGSTVLSTVLTTDHGTLTCGDALDCLRSLPADSVRLIVTAPWFQGPYVIDSTDPTSPRFGNWLVTFMEECERVLLPDGSVVLELGCTWAADRPVRTIQHYAALSRLVGEHGWHLLQELYYYNPQLMGAWDTWGGLGASRLNDCVSNFYWLSRTPDVPVDTARALEFQNTLLNQSGNLLALGDTYADYLHLRQRASEGKPPEPERNPVSVPLYFIELLTRPSDHVVDPFGGTGSTAIAAELTQRHWTCNDISRDAVGIAKDRLTLLNGHAAL